MSNVFSLWELITPALLVLSDALLEKVGPAL